jgi:hypothetical protein
LGDGEAGVVFWGKLQDKDNRKMKQPGKAEAGKRAFSSTTRRSRAFLELDHSSPSPAASLWFRRHGGDKVIIPCIHYCAKARGNIILSWGRKKKEKWSPHPSSGRSSVGREHP